MPKKKITLDDLATIIKTEFDRVDDKIDKGFAQVDVRFAQVDARFAQVDARFAQVDAQLKDLKEELSLVKDQNLRRDDYAIDRIGNHEKRLILIENNLGIKHSKEQRV